MILMHHLSKYILKLVVILWVRATLKLAVLGIHLFAKKKKKEKNICKNNK